MGPWRRERAVSFATLGKVERASHGGAIVVDDLNRVNDSSRVTWELSIGRGETTTISYELGVFE